MSQSVYPIPIRRDRAAALVAAPRRRHAAALAALFGLWCERSRQRRHLAELAEWSDHLLQDIGVSRDAARREAAKAFWQK